MSDTAPSIPLLQLVHVVSELELCMAAVEKRAAETTDFQECHGTADRVMEVLGGDAGGYTQGWNTFKARHQSDSRGVYRVDLRVPGDDQLPRWDHSFAVLKVGSDTVIYQAFQGRYSLASYLDGSAGAHARRYAATGGKALSSEVVREFFLGIERMLARFVEGKEPSGWFSCFCSTPDYEDIAGKFYADAVKLFGASALMSQIDLAIIKAAIKRGSVAVRWKRAPLKD